jgi:hypothetical protein
VRRSRGAMTIRAILSALLLTAMGTKAGYGHGTHADNLSGWTSVPTMFVAPPPRAQYGMATDGKGTIYVYGGRGEQGILGDFWAWNTGTRAWRQLSSEGMPDLIEPHLAADAAGNVYEFGGVGTPSDPHFSSDGHSFGLYEYVPGLNEWFDQTRASAKPGTDWPTAREDHGFAYDPGSNALWVFAGEGPGVVVLNDMWRYDLAAQSWQRVTQSFSAPGHARIDAREIYQISYDGQGGFYLFGGADPHQTDGQPEARYYINDLWRFTIASRRWTLLAGSANRYDPAMPVPRHYYGQAADANGNFYMLGGFASDRSSPPYFGIADTNDYATMIIFNGFSTATGTILFALSDFWEFDARRLRWIDQSAQMGVLANKPLIPYNMVLDPPSGRLITFGGYHLDSLDELSPSSQLWAFTLPAGVGR